MIHALVLEGLHKSELFSKDLVTTALKSSIRNEFDKYQDKIEHLEEFAAKLKSENETLRQHVDQQVLDQFKQQQQKQQQGVSQFYWRHFRQN